jgi:phosphopantothenoylcysteine synthetase/decarboxylase
VEDIDPVRFVSNRSSGKMGYRLAEAARDRGAKVIATACPYCIRKLNEAIAKLGIGNKIKVQDITELLLQSVDLSDPSGKTGNNNMSISQEGRRV